MSDYGNDKSIIKQIKQHVTGVYKKVINTIKKTKLYSSW